MAHANPEFALGLMRRTDGPVSAEARDIPTLADLRGRMAAVEFRIKHNCFVTEADRRAWDRWVAGQRRIRAARRISEPTSLVDVEPVARTDRPKSGERFVEPKRRWPTDVQAGRVKSRRATGKF